MTTMNLIELKEALAMLQREIRITKNNSMTYCCECNSISEDDFCGNCD